MESVYGKYTVWNLGPFLTTKSSGSQGISKSQKYKEQSGDISICLYGSSHTHHIHKRVECSRRFSKQFELWYSTYWLKKLRTMKSASSNLESEIPSEP
jgi:hypothetical protein